VSRAPPDAGPTASPDQQQAWWAPDASAQADINRIFANMGKAIAAYEKNLQHSASRFDSYVERLVRSPRDAAQPVRQTATALPAPQLIPFPYQ
jgi:cytochrome c peroxidase